MFDINIMFGPICSENFYYYQIAGDISPSNVFKLCDLIWGCDPQFNNLGCKGQSSGTSSITFALLT